MWRAVGRYTGCIENVGTRDGWEKQFTHSYGVVAADFIMQNFEEWKRIGFISNEDWSKKLHEYYNENDVKHHVGSRNLYDAIKHYSKRFGWDFIPNHLGRVDQFNNTRGKLFFQGAPF